MVAAAVLGFSLMMPVANSQTTPAMNGTSVSKRTTAWTQDEIPIVKDIAKEVHTAYKTEFPNSADFVEGERIRGTYLKLISNLIRRHLPKGKLLNELSPAERQKLVTDVTNTLLKGKRAAKEAKAHKTTAVPPSVTDKDAKAREKKLVDAAVRILGGDINNPLHRAEVRGLLRQYAKEVRAANPTSVKEAARALKDAMEAAKAQPSFKDMKNILTTKINGERHAWSPLSRRFVPLKHAA